jgi:hypothetical protein
MRRERERGSQSWLIFFQSIHPPRLFAQANWISLCQPVWEPENLLVMMLWARIKIAHTYAPGYSLAIMYSGCRSSRLSFVSFNQNDQKILGEIFCAADFQRAQVIIQKLTVQSLINQCSAALILHLHQRGHKKWTFITAAALWNKGEIQNLRWKSQFGLI